MIRVASMVYLRQNHQRRLEQTNASFREQEALQISGYTCILTQFKRNYAKLEYNAYGAENIIDEIVPNWRVFKVLMIGNNGESTFVKICLPLDESETALGSDKDDYCGERV